MMNVPGYLELLYTSSPNVQGYSQDLAASIIYSLIKYEKSLNKCDLWNIQKINSHAKIWNTLVS